MLDDFHIYNNILTTKTDANVVTKDEVSTPVKCSFNSTTQILTVLVSTAEKKIGDVAYVEIP